MSQWSARGRAYQEKAAAFLLVYTVCWICGHGGADQVDHVIPVSIAPHLKLDQSLWRPSHGVKGCPTCGRRCNQERGNRSTMPERRRSRRW